MQVTLSPSFAQRFVTENPALAANSNNAATQLQELSVDSTQLLRGKKAISIVHNGAIYRLQATKLGKLILTK